MTLPGSLPPAATPAAAPGPRSADPAPHLHEARTVPFEDVEHDPEERLYASAPIDTDDGEVVVIHQQDAPEDGGPAPGS